MRRSQPVMRKSTFRTGRGSARRSFRRGMGCRPVRRRGALSVVNSLEPSDLAAVYENAPSVACPSVRHVYSSV